MNGPSLLKLISSIILFVGFVVVPPVHALGAAETCLIVKNGSYIADPTNCQGWALCADGVPIYGTCDTGLLYNSASGTCDYADKVSCNTNTATMCTGLTNTYKADPNNCANYCYCKDGVSYCKSCPDNQYYDPLSISCVWKDKSTCVPNSPCLLAQNGFVKDTTSCNGWHRCASGQIAYSDICPSGYYYNAVTALCDYSENVECSSAPSSSTPSAPKGTCDTSTAEDGAVPFFVAQADSCRGYYYCLAVGATSAPWGQCPTQSNFDQTKQLCVDPNVVVCTANRCDGVSNKFMAVAGTQCKKYSYCVNNQISSQSSCQDDHPFLDEVNGNCVIIKPDYNICA